MLVWSFDVQLGVEGKSHAVIEAAEFLNLLGRPRLLVQELVARKADHDKGLICVAVLQRLQAGVLRREPAARRDVDRKHDLPGIHGHAFELAVESW